MPAGLLIGLIVKSAQVRGEADLDADILLVDVDGVLPELYQVVEVVFMGNSTYNTASNGDQLEPESVFLLPSVPRSVSFMVQHWPLGDLMWLPSMHSGADL